MNKVGKGEVVDSDDTKLTSEHPRDLPPPGPKRFGRYLIIKPLASGGMGTVYLAMDTQLERKVALKMMLSGPKPTPAALQRFRQEAKSLASFRHPNICPVYDSGVIDGQHFLTMAYIEGEPLAHRIPSPAPEAVQLVLKCARALQVMHDNGVVHRDLKPHNVLFDATMGEPILVDFGLALRVNQSQRRITKPNMILGTPAYVSPEQINCQTQVGPASDVYSLGVILYELLTGKRPFSDRDVHALMERIIKDPVPRLTSSCPDLDNELEEICLKALSKRPGDRYSMTEFAQALENWNATKSLRTGNTRPVPTAADPSITQPMTVGSLPTSRPKRGFPRIVKWASGVVLLITGAVILWQFASNPTKNETNVAVDGTRPNQPEGGERPPKENKSDPPVTKDSSRSAPQPQRKEGENPPAPGTAHPASIAFQHELVNDDFQQRRSNLWTFEGGEQTQRFAFDAEGVTARIPEGESYVTFALRYADPIRNGDFSLECRSTVHKGSHVRISLRGTRKDVRLEIHPTEVYAGTEFNPKVKTEMRRFNDPVVLSRKGGTWFLEVGNAGRWTRHSVELPEKSYEITDLRTRLYDTGEQKQVKVHRIRITTPNSSSGIERKK